MAPRKTDQYTTTTNVDAVRAQYGDDDAWKAANADLLARADATKCDGYRNWRYAPDATKCDWYRNWRYAPGAAQVENLATAVAEREARNAREAERKAAAEPVPTGRTTITGPVLSWKTVTNSFSYYAEDILKIVVEDQRGFRVFGTCPAKLADAARDAFYADRDSALYGSDVWKNEALKGALVTFTAQLEPSADDPHFGFFKRPTSAQLLDGSED